MSARPEAKLGPYQLAREVALRIKDHPGESARGLYQRYLPEFAEIGCDGNAGSAMIAQHLKKLAEEGLVRMEKPKAGVRAAPQWWWIDGLTEQAADALPHSECAAEPAPRPDIQPEATPEHPPAEAFVPAFSVVASPAESSQPYHPIERSLSDLALRLQSRARVDSLELKLIILNRLAELLDPEIGRWLRAIGDDLEAS